MLLRVSFLIIFTFVLCTQVSAQSKKKLSSIEINEYFQLAPLDQVFDRISEKYEIQFNFNRALAKNLEFSYLFDHTTADMAIAIIVREYKLKYIVDSNGVVNIVPKNSARNPKNLLSSNDYTQKEENNTPKTNVTKDADNISQPTQEQTPAPPENNVIEDNNASSRSLSQIIVNEAFERTKLEDVFSILSKHYGIKIEFDDQNLQDFKFSYLFEGTPADKAIEIIIRDVNIGLRNNEIGYETDGSGTIHIAAREALRNNTAATPIATQRYKGEPKKKDFPMTGNVRDIKNAETLPFVNIIVKGSKQVSQTNVDGYFTILKVPTDTSTITLQYLGYKSQVIYLNPNMPVKDVVIEMIPSASTSLQEVEIKGEKDVLSATEQVSMLKLTPSRISTLPNLGEKDIFRAFQYLPGISAANENSAGLYVRGGTPDQTLVLFDGFTVYNVDHLYGFFSAFNNNALKDVQLYKGGFGAKYGGRLSAVAEITGKEGNRKRFSAGADVSLLSANAYVETPIGDKLTVLVAARRSYQGFIYNLIADKYKTSTASASNTPTVPTGGRFGAQATTPSSYFYDLNTKITFRPNAKDIYTFSFYNGADVVDNSQIIETPTFLARRGIQFNSNIYDINNWGNTGASLKWSRIFNNSFYGNTLVSISNYYSKRDRTNQSTFTNSDGVSRVLKSGTLENNNLNDFSVKSDYEWKLNDKNNIEFGGQFTYYNIAYNYSQSDTLKLIDKNDQGTQTTFYIQDKIKLGTRFSATPGIRATYYGVTEKVYYEPRLAMHFDLTEFIKLKGAVGQYYQFTKQVTREDLINGSRNFWVLSNGTNLPVSSAQHYILGAAFENDDFLFDVEAYYKPLNNLSEYTLRYSSTVGKVNYQENFYLGTGLAKGIDFLLQKKSGKYNGWIGYTLGQVTNNFPVYGVNDYPASNNVTNEFKIVNMYKWKKWDFSLTWIYASGKPYTSPSGAYQVGLLDGTSANFISISNKNSSRLPDYHRMDASATYNFKWSAFTGSFALSLFNLYNHTNVWYKTFDISSGSLIETNVTYLGITPNVSFSLKY